MTSLIKADLSGLLYCGDTEDDVWFRGIVRDMGGSLKWTVWDGTITNTGREWVPLIKGELKNDISHNK